ncbi:helix-turn-helix domain-containing protein [Serratia symbiotica]|nr:helix-turn-helix domain-containing protein [Serratia symbiotica]USS95683.1 helix-turn-helix domain-containing protein [Serratia symbiotica]
MAPGRYHRGTTQEENNTSGGILLCRFEFINVGQCAVAPWPKDEWLIAEALGVHPSEIWPSRYFDPYSDRLLDRKARIKS